MTSYLGSALLFFVPNHFFLAYPTTPNSSFVLRPLGTAIDFYLNVMNACETRFNCNNHVTDIDSSYLSEFFVLEYGDGVAGRRPKKKRTSLFFHNRRHLGQAYDRRKGGGGGEKMRGLSNRQGFLVCCKGCMEKESVFLLPNFLPYKGATGQKKRISIMTMHDEGREDAEQKRVLTKFKQYVRTLRLVKSSSCFILVPSFHHQSTVSNCLCRPFVRWLAQDPKAHTH